MLGIGIIVVCEKSAFRQLLYETALVKYLGTRMLVCQERELLFSFQARMYRWHGGETITQDVFNSTHKTLMILRVNPTINL